MKKNFLLLTFVLLSCNIYSQVVGIKSNLLYDATTSLNLGVEVALDSKLTLIYRVTTIHGNSMATNSSNTGLCSRNYVIGCARHLMVLFSVYMHIMPNSTLKE